MNALALVDELGLSGGATHIGTRTAADLRHGAAPAQLVGPFLSP